MVEGQSRMRSRLKRGVKFTVKTLDALWRATTWLEWLALATLLVGAVVLYVYVSNIWVSSMGFVIMFCVGLRIRSLAVRQRGSD